MEHKGHSIKEDLLHGDARYRGPRDEDCHLCLGDKIAFWVIALSMLYMVAQIVRALVS